MGVALRLRRTARVRIALALVLGACGNDFAVDGAALAGPPGSGGLIAGRFFEHTNCAANASGEVRCFSSCSPIVYGMAEDLTTIARVDAPADACDGALDEAGNATLISDAAVVVTHADGSVAGISSVVPRQVASAHGRIALVADDDSLQIYDAATGAPLWSKTGVREVAMRSDGGVAAVGANGVVVYAADGTQLWTQAGSAVGVGPHDEVAIALRDASFVAQIELHDANGALRWSHATTPAELADFHLATDGSDVFVAADGQFDDIAGGLSGDVSRFSKDGLVWASPVYGWAPKVRILALTADALVIQASVAVGSIDQDRYVPDDHAVTGVGSALLVTEGAGQLIAKVGR